MAYDSTTSNTSPGGRSSLDCGHLHPLRRDGTNRNERLVPALDPSYALVDERDVADLLVYARRYAQLLRYYNVENEPNGDWTIFIDNDVSTLVALIGTTGTERLRESFDTAAESVLQALPVDRPAAFARLFDPILEIALLFDGWYRRSVEGLSLRSSLDRLIRSELSGVLVRVVGAALRAVDPAVGLDAPTVNIGRFSEVWDPGEILPDTTLFPTPDVDAELEAAVARLRGLFDRFNEGLHYTVERAPSFLDETLERHPAHAPHMALFLAYLKLFAYAQQHLNTFTRRHLDFYYRDVLGLDYRPEEPDAVHLIFELARNVIDDEYLVRKGTQVKAGKDDTGVELFFATDEDIVVNRASVDPDRGLKSIFIDREIDEDGNDVVCNIYAARDADSADGLGADLEDEDGKWQTFGSTSMPFATVGFAVASPSFLLSEGTRRVELTFTAGKLGDFLHGRSKADVEKELQLNVDVEFSGEKGWVPAEIEGVGIVERGDEVDLTYALLLAADVGAVVPFSSEVHGAGFDTRFPVVRFLLDNEGYAVDTVSPEILRAVKRGAQDVVVGGERFLGLFDLYEEYSVGSVVRHGKRLYRARNSSRRSSPLRSAEDWEVVGRSYPYRYFRRLELMRLEISIEVTGVRTVLLENDQGVLNPAKPFMPFGTVPKIGSSFYVGSAEIFGKTLESLTLTITWGDLPTENFSEYYAEYTDADITGNGSFTAEVEVLRDGSWPPVISGTSLFNGESVPAGRRLQAPVETRNLTLNPGLIRAPEMEDFDRYNPSLLRGFLRLKLKKSFEHRSYPTYLADSIPNGTVPNQPYTPLITELTVNYSASDSIDFTTRTDEDFESRIERFFHIHPFGHAEFFPATGESKSAPIDRIPVPRFTVTETDEKGAKTAGVAEGTLYVGLSGLDPPRNLSILFQVAEGSADPALERQAVVWSGLIGNVWRDFESREILSDTTNGLLTSGIVTFAVPKEMDDEHTVLDRGLYWLRASVVQDTAAISRLISVMPQAVQASYRNLGNDPDRLNTALPAETISKLKNRPAAIKGITQPYASFGGRPVEGLEDAESRVPAPLVEARESAPWSRDFHARVSERLRHKGRGITLFDYERLVLEKFPEVYKVKCITHTQSGSEHAPGHVRLVVVPDLRNRNAVDPLQPMVSLNTLDEIGAFLRSIISDFIDLEVKNPTYEQIRVDFRVAFVPGTDVGYHTTLLDLEIVRYLSPWLYEEGADLAFGGRIHRSWILNFVEERDYVDYVTEFRMDRITAERTYHDVEEALTSTSSSVLVSAASHNISHIVASTCPTVPTS